MLDDKCKIIFVYREQADLVTTRCCGTIVTCLPTIWRVSLTISVICIQGKDFFHDVSSYLCKMQNMNLKVHQVRIISSPHLLLPSCSWQGQEASWSSHWHGEEETRGGQEDIGGGSLQFNAFRVKVIFVFNVIFNISINLKMKKWHLCVVKY